MFCLLIFFVQSARSPTLVSGVVARKNVENRPGVPFGCSDASGFRSDAEVTCRLSRSRRSVSCAVCVDRRRWTEARTSEAHTDTPHLTGHPPHRTRTPRARVKRPRSRTPVFEPVKNRSAVTRCAPRRAATRLGAPGREGTPGGHPHSSPLKKSRSTSVDKTWDAAG